jgi:hypothetical protein
MTLGRSRSSDSLVVRVHILARLYYRPVMVDDLAGVVRDRPGWMWLSGEGVATYRIRPDEWAATVRRPAMLPRASQRWHVTGVHLDGAAAWSTFAGTAREAVRLAEAWVRAQEDR